ncbi:hypothetical protein PPACK8108_LOCUS4667 [Phakopsora pachyrhizi]|uniref:Uncharacterized protein n=1 Tax=Phakopsora pachyrhizi TaxID=170000 RepID=A0AAV0AMH8_PHAPC|nr:hypothetical protein PPACK8108_LOCUS4667 [Phakopsora pachyrhizi]
MLGRPLCVPKGDIAWDLKTFGSIVHAHSQLWAGLDPGLGPGAGRAGRQGLGWAGDEIRTKLRPVLKPERQAEGFWVKANERLVRDVDHVAVVEKASFESGCDFDTKVVQGVMWH